MLIFVYIKVQKQIICSNCSVCLTFFTTCNYLGEKEIHIHGNLRFQDLIWDFKTLQVTTVNAQKQQHIPVIQIHQDEITEFTTIAISITLREVFEYSKTQLSAVKTKANRMNTKQLRTVKKLPTFFKHKRSHRIPRQQQYTAELILNLLAANPWEFLNQWHETLNILAYHWNQSTALANQYQNMLCLNSHIAQQPLYQRK